MKYGDKIIYMEGVIVEIHDGCVGIDLKGRLGYLKIPMRMLITDYPLVVGQEVGWNMSFVEQLGPDANEKYVSNLQTYQRRVKGLQSEIFVPVTPPPVWAPVKKELKDMTIALATAAGVHHKDQKRFNLAGDFTWRKITDKMPSDELMVSHGGYDNSDVNKDINCMFPIDRIHELAKEGFIKACAPVHAGFMGGGGNQEKFKHETGPAIAKMFVEEGVDAVILTAG